MEEKDQNKLAKINNEIVMPVVSPEEAKAQWEKYEQLKTAIVKDTDIQKIENKDFLKKSYWRKLATFFNLTTEIVEERKEQIGKTLVWHFTVKAIAPNGRSAIGTGSCDCFEKATLKEGKYVKPRMIWSEKFKKMVRAQDQAGNIIYEPATPNSIHNIRTTAETRATNRAISNLVGGGEVSAEEVSVGEA